ncbi:hypothetical protein BOH72_17250 [Mycobacterium sp. WY10]|nr:hypothetical protein BOH72_17250 [Mycobacterium sp. WY10]
MALACKLLPKLPIAATGVAAVVRGAMRIVAMAAFGTETAVDGVVAAERAESDVGAELVAVPAVPLLCTPSLVTSAARWRFDGALDDSGARRRFLALSDPVARGPVCAEAAPAAAFVPSDEEADEFVEPVESAAATPWPIATAPVSHAATAIPPYALAFAALLAA